MRKDKEERTKDLIKKLQALAERGVGGEKITAQQKLEQILYKNGLTLDDLVEEKEEYHLFSYNGQHKKRILLQIIYKVIGAKNFGGFYKSRGTRQKIGVHCTSAQKIEIELEYEFYSNLFDEELELFTSAFIDKQMLYPDDAPVEEIDALELSEEEYERLKKKQAYMRSIDKKNRRIMIEGGDRVEG